MAKKGTEFELFVKAIYEEILVLDSCDTVKVLHDVKLKGRSGQKHQIDVFWEFRSGGVTHRVAVECKDYRSTVSIGRVRDFYGALNDIGNIRGVFVTTKGYQSGAVTYANHEGISLKIVQEPSEEDIQSHLGIKSIVLKGHGLCLSNVEVEPIFDVEWIFRNTDIKEGDVLSVNILNDHIKMMDSNLNLLGTFRDFENNLPRRPENTKSLSCEYDFDDGFMHVLNSIYPPLKLKKIRYKYDTFTLISENKINFKLMAQAVLKDIITGDIHLYNKKSESEVVSKL